MSVKLHYRWVQTATFQADCYVENLLLNLEGTRLLTGGKCIQMWNYNNPSEDTILEEDEFADKLQFQVGGKESDLFSISATSSNSSSTAWKRKRTNSNFPSTFSAHDFRSFDVHGTGMIPGFHFHLAASINAETDISLWGFAGTKFRLKLVE
uniref:Uncharacterized protein n=1 Tax=Strigamia maritima TaxID=126957 RepID=T1IMB3_STRMM